MSAVTPREIIDEEEDSAGLRRGTIRGARHDRVVVLARAAAARRLRAELGLSYPAIGRELGGRHHATVMCYFRTDAEKEARARDSKLRAAGLYRKPVTRAELVAEGAGL
ncbi:MAG TPA: helix-turn-helix domain-containing protein [Jatrophihabitantaceae bacterium]|nr:helix-turn-helix domain-containing protein [Jatrophihabitantaceae bacterium]